MFKEELVGSFFALCILCFYGLFVVWTSEAKCINTLPNNVHVLILCSWVTGFVSIHCQIIGSFEYIVPGL